MSSIVLIGLPGAGKSTLGVVLAKALAMPFIDTDLLIQQKVEQTLQAYLDTYGYLALRAVEQDVLTAGGLEHAVVATGGSAVYSEPAMLALGKIGVRVYLKISLATMLVRINNQATRGIASAPGLSLADIYAERSALYERYADITVDANSGPLEAVIEEVIRLTQ